MHGFPRSDVQQQSTPPGIPIKSHLKTSYQTIIKTKHLSLDVSRILCGQQVMQLTKECMY